MDLTYGELKELIGAKVPGLLALLKTLKKQKKVDYNDEGKMMTDAIVITAIGDDDNKKTDFIPYTEILEKIGGTRSAHEKVGGW